MVKRENERKTSGSQESMPQSNTEGEDVQNSVISLTHFEAEYLFCDTPD